MDKNLENRLQAIKAQEQAIKEQKDFIRASFIAAVKETTNPSIKKIGNFLHIISYKDMENWDVSGTMLRNSLCSYIEENPLSVTLKVIKKLENELVSLSASTSQSNSASVAASEEVSESIRNTCRRLLDFTPLFP